jgi:hypothetical protein
MKTKTKISSVLVLVALFGMTFTSCQKSADLNLDSSELANQIGAVSVVPSSNILSGTTTTSSTDSVFAMDACRKDHKRNSVAQGALSATITTYLTTNYAGYTFAKAFSTTLISTNVLDSYVVAIMFNGKPVAVRFDASGIFVKVLELREGRDLNRKGGHHEGGCFDNRDGKQKDSLALSALPQTIKQYFATNFPQDTLKDARIGKDGSILVLSKNVSYFGTAFKGDGTFIKRESITSHPGKGTVITQDKLPAIVTSYLTTTYPNYVFDKAFEHKDNGTLKGYMVVIDANLTKYAVLFDATGSFKKAQVIR